ncbi:ester cyclase [Methylobacterium sp. E-045]|uniref:ester cyclase n=1 Tax=Methylobacterium sp. E-045 TaxID=2836575 RepID=UPI001FBABB90|nr:ester cyclase [Methylobacterium sp. E-045]MCJ2129774.1 ester cyclase [Methylobacterium sp. E-045]
MIPPIRSIALVLVLASSPAVAETLVAPKVLILEPGPAARQRDAVVLAARRYATFWHTGDPTYARAALADGFVDETPPPGRVQGPSGPLLASEVFRKAVPDLTCEVEQMIVAGDRAVLHLHLRGHFTGTFEGRQGHGEPVAFVATDIYRVVKGRIAANWHIEDNLTLLRQLGALPTQ